ncbi:LisH dimerization motif containing protein [Pseudohyphozyma bogoriensis]|nr:LisH dimerization motif containing protein [Pseudohyphozyma bogoriensis]
MASGQMPPPTSPSGSQHWEGDSTLHSYCYDYMRKRGWTDTARAFARDAGINEDEWKGPPIEAPQGLLYENIMADEYVEPGPPPGGPGPGSTHNSPHLANMAPPGYGGNGGRLPPTPMQGREQGPPQGQQGGGGPGGPNIFMQGMAAVGLGGRDPESLNQEEMMAVQSHLRKMGVPPNQMQPPYRGGPPPGQARVVSQRMHPDQQRIQQQGQYLQQGLSPQHAAQAQAQAQAQAAHAQQAQQQQQARMAADHQHQMMQHQQNQQREHIQNQQRTLQQRQQGGNPQMGYGPGSQAGSPGPMYATVGSPYGNTVPPHMPQHPGQAASPPPAFSPPIPPPSRNANANNPPGAAGKPRAVSAKMSPANSKRGGNIDDPSPRSRKRARAGTKDEEMGGGMGEPEQPRFDLSGPSSPSTGMPPPQGGGLPPPGQGMHQPGGSPYQPSRSPLPSDAASRGALDALQLSSQARMAQQTDEGLQNGTIDHPNGRMNGANSRPGSAASNYANPMSSYTNNDGGPPPGGPPGGNPTPSPRNPPSQLDHASPGFHLTLPSPSANNFQLNGADLTPGGSRPFAGAGGGPGSGGMPTVPLPPPAPSTTPLPPNANGGDPSAPFQFTGDDVFGDLSTGISAEDLGNLDFAFDAFLDDSMFKDDTSLTL